MRFTIYLIVVLLLTACGKQDSAQHAASLSHVASPAVSLKNASISGQVFVVTQGRENIKLALVEVTAIPDKEFLTFLEPKRINKHEQLGVLNSSLDVLKKEKLEAGKTAKSAQLKLESSPCYSEYGWGELYDREIPKCNPLLDNISRANSINGKKQKAINEVESKIAYFNNPAFYFSSLPHSKFISKTDADGKFLLSLPTGKFAITATSSRQVGSHLESYYWLVWVDVAAENQQIMLSNDNLLGEKCKECVSL